MTSPGEATNTLPCLAHKPSLYSNNRNEPVFAVSLYRQKIWPWGLLWDRLSKSISVTPTCTKITLRIYSLQLMVTKFINQRSSKPSLLWLWSVHCRSGFSFGVKICSCAYPEIVFSHLGMLKHWHTQQESSNKMHPRKTHCSSSLRQQEVVFLPPSYLGTFVGLHTWGQTASKCYTHILAGWAKILNQNAHSQLQAPSLWDLCIWWDFPGLFTEGSVTIFQDYSSSLADFNENQNGLTGERMSCYILEAWRHILFVHP